MTLVLPVQATRTKVDFSKVEASYYDQDTSKLELTIDGRSASSTGWNLGDQLEEPQAIIFTTKEPVEADLLELSLCFMSGRPHSAFAEFSTSFTTDVNPSHDSNWRPLPVLNHSAITCKLTTGPNNRILAEETSTVVTGMIPDEIYRISTRLPGIAVTGFRIDVFPKQRTTRKNNPPVMAWSADGDFTLTEFLVEVLSTSTNVALGASVTATHPLYQSNNPIYKTVPKRYLEMTADAITDGWPSTLAHPGKEVAWQNFHFEIDLGQQRNIDHINLRQRGDDHSLHRFGKMRIKLYEKDPNTGATPTWQILNRPDGSYPEPGSVDTLHAMDGEGKFHGRYIRISSESEVPMSPQLAEIEVYETRTPQLAAVIADDHVLAKHSQLRIPPAIGRLGFQFEIPQTGQPLSKLYRWRLVGENTTWQISNSLLLETACPPAGAHRLELQAAHSDGTWDASVLDIPFVVDAKFTETPAFLWLIGCVTLIIGILLARYVAKRKIRQLEAQSALSMERSRIAANMHDDVGARLAQIAVLHDVFAAEHDLSSTAQADLSKLAAYTRGAMAALDEAVWAVNPQNNTISALASFLIQYADNYLLPLGIDCRIVSPNQWPELDLRSGVRHEIALTFKEALQNIVKHADASEVSITLVHESKQFIIKIADNGCGFSNNTISPGQDGLINMSKRLKSIDGICEWLPNENGGTTVKIQFPTS
jgi:signal transduction histidine kinase